MSGDKQRVLAVVAVVGVFIMLCFIGMAFTLSGYRVVVTQQTVYAAQETAVPVNSYPQPPPTGDVKLWKFCGIDRYDQEVCVEWYWDGSAVRPVMPQKGEITIDEP